MEQQLLVAIAIGVISLFVILLFVWRSRKQKRSVVLLLGTCEAGKTSLFAQLVHGKDVGTYTSQKENSGCYSVANKTALQLVDVPGHERVRSKFVEQYKSTTRAIVYVVDSSAIQKQLRDVAEFLFNVLSNPTIFSNRCPLLVACNKQDLDLAKGTGVVQRELEKEINLLRETHSRTLSGTGNTGVVDHMFLGIEGKDFSFKDLKNKVEFCESSAVNDTELTHIKKWLSSIA